MRRRIRYGETWAGLSALALLGFMFLDWFHQAPLPLSPDGKTVTSYPSGWTAYAPVSGGGISGWDSLGWLALALCVLAILAGLAVPIVYARSESPALPEVAAIVAGIGGTLAAIALIVQVIFQPGPDQFVSVQSGWWLGLLATVGIARGGYLSMHDEFVPDVPLPDVEVRPAPSPSIEAR